MESQWRYCDKDKASGDITKFGLQKMGLDIYVHRKRDSISTKARWSKTDETYLLHNLNNIEIRQMEYDGGLCQLQPKCFQCKRIIDIVRSLLDDLKEIRDNQMLRICNHCKNVKNTRKCLRCEFILTKLQSNTAQAYEERQERFKAWLCRVRHLLQIILDGGNICQQRVHQDTDSFVELQNLLRQLRAPLGIHEPNMEFFPIEKDLVSLQNLTESKEMIDELMLKLNNVKSVKPYSSDDSLYPTPSKMCVCKYFMDKKFDGALSELNVLQDGEKDESKLESADREAGKEIKKTDKDESNKKMSQYLQIVDVKSPKSLNKNLKEHISMVYEKQSKRKLSKETKQSKTKKEPERKNKKSEMTDEEKIFSKLWHELKLQKKERKAGVLNKENKKGLRPIEIRDLPTLKPKVQNVLETDSESFIECEESPKEPTQIIKDISIVPYEYISIHEKENTSRIPLLFEIYDDTECQKPLCDPAMLIQGSQTDLSKGKFKPGVTVESILEAKGTFRYALSNRDFIENGITKLPVDKVVRKMNIYKMETPYPNWFELNKSSTKYYDNGELLAEIDESGCGKWYYKNGALALDYYNAEEINTRRRYVVYSSNIDLVTGKYKTQTVLASFDFLGNGVVYDCHGKIRLKYNQSEGEILDEKIAPLSKWKWHALNDPPVLTQVFLNTNLRNRDPILEAYHDMLLHESCETTMNHQRKEEQEALMLSLELEHFVQEKADKLLQEYKPFQIRTKAVKLNEQFSLRILDQANIKLIFRDMAINLKINVGLRLKNNEIIDVSTADLSEVATPYDSKAPKTNSVANIQSIVNRVRKENQSPVKPKW